MRSDPQRGAMRIAAHRLRGLLGLVALAGALVASGCSADDDTATTGSSSTDTTTTSDLGPGETYAALAEPVDCALEQYRDAYGAVFGPDDYAERTQWDQIRTDLLPRRRRSSTGPSSTNCSIGPGPRR